MPRYFFHIHDGQDFHDEEGAELPDRRAAQVKAIALAGRVIADEAYRVALGEDWRMDVVDETGLLLFQLDFHITAAPALRDAYGRENWAG